MEEKKGCRAVWTTMIVLFCVFSCWLPAYIVGSMGFMKIGEDSGLGSAFDKLEETVGAEIISPDFLYKGAGVISAFIALAIALRALLPRKSGS